MKQFKVERTLIFNAYDKCPLPDDIKTKVKLVWSDAVGTCCSYCKFLKDLRVDKKGLFLQCLQDEATDDSPPFNTKLMGKNNEE